MTSSANLASGGPVSFAMRLLIGSLAVLFAASIVGYLVTRARLDGGEVVIPPLLWASTAALLISGGVLELASRRLHGGRADTARPLLLAASVGSVVFLALQTPALMQLLAAHPAALEAGNPLLGFVFFLVLLHALHVVGGVVALAVVLWRTRNRRPTADQDGPAVRQTARYWHFLDLVWVVMFAVFLLG
jgi:cytochrome c oxidase subunit 3